MTNLKLISLSERHPHVDQDVIVYNLKSKKLLAAKYVVQMRYNPDDQTTNPKGGFQVEKYSSNADRSIITYWITEQISHWMPADINE